MFYLRWGKASSTKIILVIDVTSLLRLWSCRINHNTSATRTQPYRTDGRTDRLTNTLALRRLVEPFFQLCCCVSFLFWREIGCGFTYYLCTLEYHKVVGLCQFFSFQWEIVFGVWYIWYLLYSYSCAVVSVFWLWREKVLKMRTRFYKKILLGYFIMIHFYHRSDLRKIIRFLRKIECIEFVTNCISFSSN